MEDNSKPIALTRSEFYSVMALVCYLLAMALLGIAGIHLQNELLFIGYFILFIAAVGLGFFFSVSTLRERRRQSRQKDAVV
jgi:NADH:ubiquinone oxidoreductase subunit 6 (subunit J)